MRALIAVVLAAALLWCGYWFVGSGLVEGRTKALFEQAAARGLVAEQTGIAVRGFPNRFDLTLDNPKLFDPGSGYGWQGPFLQIFALTYRPWHLIAAFPPEQRIDTPAGPLTVTAAKLQASLRARPEKSLPLDQFTLVGEGVGVSGGAGVTATARELRFATRDLEGTGLRHEIGLEVAELAPDPALMARLPGLPASIARLHLDAEARLSAPLDRFAVRRPPEVTAITLKEALVDWGEVTAHVSGELAPDAAGFAAGTLTLRLSNWRKVLAAAEAAGLLPPAFARNAGQMLQAVSQGSGEAATIEVPLRLSGGAVSFAFFQLGPAPRWP